MAPLEKDTIDIGREKALNQDSKKAETPPSQVAKEAKNLLRQDEKKVDTSRKKPPRQSGKKVNMKTRPTIDPDLVVAAGLGQAVGDALGVPVEFNSRQKLEENPVVGMRAFGTHCMPQGVWSDDTSMTIATVDSLIKNHRFDYDDIMDKFVEWRFEGDYTPGGHCFDIGGTCSRALHNYVNGAPALDSGCRGEHSNGNGSLMRIMPIAFVAHQNQLSPQATYDLTAKVSQLTHGHIISIFGCYLFVQYLRYLLEGNSPWESYLRLQFDTDCDMAPPRAKVHYNRLTYHNIKDYRKDEIESSGFVVHTLEASLWSLLNTDNFPDAVLTAVNLGEDTDTTGAVTGVMAGLAYGLESIPAAWLEQLERTAFLECLYQEFAKALPYIKV